MSHVGCHHQRYTLLWTCNRTGIFCSPILHGLLSRQPNVVPNLHTHDRGSGNAWWHARKRQYFQLIGRRLDIGAANLTFVARTTISDVASSWGHHQKEHIWHGVLNLKLNHYCSRLSVMPLILLEKVVDNNKDPNTYSGYKKDQYCTFHVSLGIGIITNHTFSRAPYIILKSTAPVRWI